jgi:hypothetical protein
MTCRMMKGHIWIAIDAYGLWGAVGGSDYSDDEAKRQAAMHTEGKCVNYHLVEVDIPGQKLEGRTLDTEQTSG